MNVSNPAPDRAPRRLITVTGPDRPGLVAAVSRVLSEEGADIEDVSMTRLSGNFATMLLARGGNDEAVRSRLAEIERQFGLRIHFDTAVEEGDDPDSNSYISAVGPNRIGIVATLSEILARHQANITEMTTRLLERTEVPVYLVRIEAVVPGDWEALRAELAGAAHDLAVEITLHPTERADL